MDAVAVLASTGANYNVYLLDEDRILVGVSFNILHANVITAGFDLMTAEACR